MLAALRVAAVPLRAFDRAASLRAPGVFGLDPTVVASAAKSILSRFCDQRRPDFLQKAPFVKSDAPTGRHTVALIDETRPGSTGEMSKVSRRGRRPPSKSGASWVFLPNGG